MLSYYSKAPAFAFDSSDSDDDFSAMRRKKDSASSFKSSIGKTQADTRPNTAPVIAPTASKANQERNANASKVGGDEQGSFHVLPALSRSSSHYNVMDNDKTSSQKKIVSDSEDDLDVSGIVRIDDTIETKIKRSPDKSPSNSKVKKKSNGNSTEELLDMSTDTLNLSKEEFAPQRSSSPTKSKAVGSSSNSMTSSGNSVTKSSTWASKNNIAAVVTNKATTDIVSPRQSISPTARRRPKDTEEVKLSDASQRDASSIGSMHPQQSSSPDWKINESNSKTNSQNLKISLQDSGAFGENSVDGFRRSSLTSPVGQTSLDRDSSIKIRKLQDALEAMSLEKEAIERHLKLEINLLKEQLADGSKEKELMQTRIHQLEDQLVKNGIELIENLDKSVEFKTNTAQSKTLLHLEQEKFLLIQQEQKSENNKLSLMNNNNERTIIQLEAEISRLKDEININALKFHSNLKESRDKHEVELSDMKVKYDEELKTLERRHKDSIDALNKIHNDELEAVKDRNRSGQVFEQVASQIKSTSGSIKLIEEQLNVRYRSIDAAREGQMEARERLLADMEMKAREKAEQAEAETFRLKGILNHMEHVIDNIRSQSTEEKERLRQEQLRLTTLLSSVEAEKKALQQRNSEELAYIKQKSKELELESVRLLEEKRNFFESIASSQRSIDREKAEFETFANHKRRTLESLETQLHDSEMKLKREKEEFFSDKTSFEMRRREAIASIESIESDKRKLFDEQENLRREREQLKSLANEVQQVMNTISEKEKEIEVHSAGLSEREIVLREGYAQMKQSATILSKREAAVQDSIRLLEDKQMSLEAIDEQLFNRKYKLLPHSNRPRDDYEPIPSSYATLERSTLVPSISPNSNQHPFSGGLPRPVSESNNNPTTNSKVRFNEFDSKSIEFEISNEEKWIDKFQQRLSTTYYTAANNTNAVPKELLEAKRVLEKSRSDLDRIASNNLNMNKILHREKEFLKLMQKK